MEGDKTADNEKELTSTSSSLVGKILSTNKEDKGDSNDTLPTSSTDASTSVKSTDLVSDDPISSTSSEMDPSKPRVNDISSCDVVDKASTNLDTDEAELLEMSIVTRPSEKIEENVDDLVSDLETLLGGSGDSFSASSKSTPTNEEKIEVTSAFQEEIASQPEEKPEDEVSSNTDTAKEKTDTPEETGATVAQEKIQDGAEENVAANSQQGETATDFQQEDTANESTENTTEIANESPRNVVESVETIADIAEDIEKATDVAKEVAEDITTLSDSAGDVVQESANNLSNVCPAEADQRKESSSQGGSEHADSVETVGHIEIIPKESDNDENAEDTENTSAEVMVGKLRDLEMKTPSEQSEYLPSSEVEEVQDGGDQKLEKDLEQTGIDIKSIKHDQSEHSQAESVPEKQKTSESAECSLQNMATETAKREKTENVIIPQDGEIQDSNKLLPINENDDTSENEKAETVVEPQVNEDADGSKEIGEKVEETIEESKIERDMEGTSRTVEDPEESKNESDKETTEETQNECRTVVEEEKIADKEKSEIMDVTGRSSRYDESTSEVVVSVGADASVSEPPDIPESTEEIPKKIDTQEIEANGSEEAAEIPGIPPSEASVSELPEVPESIEQFSEKIGTPQDNEENKSEEAADIPGVAPSEEQGLQHLQDVLGESIESQKEEQQPCTKENLVEVQDADEPMDISDVQTDEILEVSKPLEEDIEKESASLNQVNEAPLDMIQDKEVLASVVDVKETVIETLEVPQAPEEPSSGEFAMDGPELEESPENTEADEDRSVIELEPSDPVSPEQEQHTTETETIEEQSTKDTPVEGIFPENCASPKGKEEQLEVPPDVSKDLKNQEQVNNTEAVEDRSIIELEPSDPVSPEQEQHTTETETIEEQSTKDTPVEGIIPENCASPKGKEEQLEVPPNVSKDIKNQEQVNNECETSEVIENRDRDTSEPSENTQMTQDDCIERKDLPEKLMEEVEFTELPEGDVVTEEAEMVETDPVVEEPEEVPRSDKEMEPPEDDIQEVCQEQIDKQHLEELEDVPVVIEADKDQSENTEVVEEEEPEEILVTEAGKDQMEEAEASKEEEMPDITDANENRTEETQVTKDEEPEGILPVTDVKEDSTEVTELTKEGEFKEMPFDTDKSQTKETEVTKEEEPEGLPVVTDADKIQTKEAEVTKAEEIEVTSVTDADGDKDQTGEAEDALKEIPIVSDKSQTEDMDVNEAKVEESTNEEVEDSMQEIIERTEVSEVEEPEESPITDIDANKNQTEETEVVKKEDPKETPIVSDKNHSEDMDVNESEVKESTNEVCAPVQELTAETDVIKAVESEGIPDNDSDKDLIEETEMDKQEPIITDNNQTEDMELNEVEVKQNINEGAEDDCMQEVKEVGSPKDVESDVQQEKPSIEVVTTDRNSDEIHIDSVGKLNQDVTETIMSKQDFTGESKLVEGTAITTEGIEVIEEDTATSTKDIENNERIETVTDEVEESNKQSSEVIQDVQQEEIRKLEEKMDTADDVKVQESEPVDSNNDVEYVSIKDDAEEKTLVPQVTKDEIEEVHEVDDNVDKVEVASEGNVEEQKEPVEEIKPTPEINIRRKTVEQDLEKVVCLSEESSDSDSNEPVSSLPKPNQDDTAYEDDADLIKIAGEVERFPDPDLPCEDSMPGIEDILAVQPNIIPSVEPVDSASNLETILAVASLQNESVSEVRVERRLSEKEIREMEAIRMAVASITDSSQDTYDSYLVDNSGTIDNSIQEISSDVPELPHEVMDISPEQEILPEGIVEGNTNDDNMDEKSELPGSDNKTEQNISDIVALEEVDDSSQNEATAIEDDSNKNIGDNEPDKKQVLDTVEKIESIPSTESSENIDSVDSQNNDEINEGESVDSSKGICDDTTSETIMEELQEDVVQESSRGVCLDTNDTNAEAKMEEVQENAIQESSKGLCLDTNAEAEMEEIQENAIQESSKGVCHDTNAEVEVKEVQGNVVQETSKEECNITNNETKMEEHLEDMDKESSKKACDVTNAKVETKEPQEDVVEIAGSIQNNKLKITDEKRVEHESAAEDLRSDEVGSPDTPPNENNISTISDAAAKENVAATSEDDAAKENETSAAEEILKDNQRSISDEVCKEIDVSPSEVVVKNDKISASHNIVHANEETDVLTPVKAVAEDKIISQSFAEEKAVSLSEQGQGSAVQENDVSVSEGAVEEEEVAVQENDLSVSKETVEEKEVTVQENDVSVSEETVEEKEVAVQENDVSVSEETVEEKEVAVQENDVSVSKETAEEKEVAAPAEQVVEERPLRSRTRRGNKVSEPLSISVEEVEKREKLYSPKVTIKPVKVPDEEVSTTSDADGNKGGLKMTITKQSDKMHSILKVYDPEDETETTQNQEEPIPKLIIKPKIQQVEQQQQHSPKMTTRSAKAYSPTSTRCSSPRITIKPVTKPAETKTEALSPIKITFKPVVKPDEGTKRHSPKPSKEQDQRNHNPKITIKPIPKPVELDKEETPSSTPKVTIKPIKRHAEETDADIEQERSSPKITIKPVVKPTEQESDQSSQTGPKLKIKPIKKHDDEEVSTPEKEQGSPKISIKPIIKPLELEEEEEEVKERIVLKINKGNIPTPTKDPKKREHPDDDKAEKVGIKLKFSTTGGHTHIVQEGEESTTKRLRKDSGYSGGPAKKDTEEPSHKRALEEKQPEKNKRLRSTDAPDKSHEESNDGIKIVETKVDSPIVISEDSRSQHSADCMIVEDTHPGNTDISKIVNIASRTTHIEASPVLTVVVATPDVTPAPKKRGRPRKAPLEVREELKDLPRTPLGSQKVTPQSTPVSETASTPGSDVGTPEATPSPGGRPKRSCRGQNVIATLGIKPRKPRGGGRGRGGKVNMGDRTPPVVQAPVEPIQTVSMKPEKEVKLTKAKLKLMQKAAEEEAHRRKEVEIKQKAVEAEKAAKEKDEEEKKKKDIHLKKEKEEKIQKQKELDTQKATDDAKRKALEDEKERLEADAKEKKELEEKKEKEFEEAQKKEAPAQKEDPSKRKKDGIEEQIAAKKKKEEKTPPRKLEVTTRRQKAQLQKEAEEAEKEVADSPKLGEKKTAGNPKTSPKKAAVVITALTNPSVSVAIVSAGTAIKKGERRTSVESTSAVKKAERRTSVESTTSTSVKKASPSAARRTSTENNPNTSANKKTPPAAGRKASTESASSTSAPIILEEIVVISTDEDSCGKEEPIVKSEEVKEKSTESKVETSPETKAKTKNSPPKRAAEKTGEKLVEEKKLKVEELPKAKVDEVKVKQTNVDENPKEEEQKKQEEKEILVEEKEILVEEKEILVEEKEIVVAEEKEVVAEEDKKEEETKVEGASAEEEADSGEDSEAERRREWVLLKKQEAIKKCRAKRMEKLARAAELKKKRQEQAAQQREARKAAEEAEKAAAEKTRATKRYGRYGVPKPQISLIDEPVQETAGTVKSHMGLFDPETERINITQPVIIDDDCSFDKERAGPLKHLEGHLTPLKSSSQKLLGPESMVVDSADDTPTKLRRSLGTEDVVMLDEDTRMSADLRGSRAQTPAKQFIPPPDMMVDDSQGSMGTEGGKSRSSKTPKMEVFQDLESTMLTADQLAEYSWNGQGPFMLQEQVAQYLGIKSFKRKYPNVTRRQVDMQERDYLKENGYATEAQCDLGLTAVIAQDILDIMYTDFQDKYEDYCRCQREKQARELANKQKALSQFTLKPGFDKLDILEQAVQSAAAWNQQFNKARREQRKAHMDLQNLTVHYPKNKVKVVPTTKIGHYPVALVPGQFTDHYQEFTPTELNNLPLNTMCYKEIKIPGTESDSQSSSSDSDSESSSGSSSDSDSSCHDEDCKECDKKAKTETNGVRETDSDDVVIIENDASSSDSVVLVSVTAAPVTA